MTQLNNPILPAAEAESSNSRLTQTKRERPASRFIPNSTAKRAVNKQRTYAAAGKRLRYRSVKHRSGKSTLPSKRALDRTVMSGNLFDPMFSLPSARPMNVDKYVWSKIKKAVPRDYTIIDPLFERIVDFTVMQRYGVFDEQDIPVPAPDGVE
ncbi:hypothetical protein [Paenibacillus xerothermodurans]|uniref:Uncharacterized protein n=1 Tax=Paenibacillus xerothermodurans TaxID=1977292 RepID=A0A2W1N9K3_PAEXE|nr:hypothetical protein [Paenibacillus xerothermodurans]PZE20614.1 hypothetical protein CBW46_012670 [Paenibacillus xerothermodurans]